MTRTAWAHFVKSAIDPWVNLREGSVNVVNPYPQNYCCEEDEHAWGKAEEVAMIVPEVDAKVHRSQAQTCLKCGAIRRARDADGNVIGDVS